MADYRNNLKSIKASTLIVWGGKDLCQESWVKQYTDYIPHSKAIKINDCGHFAKELMLNWACIMQGYTLVS
jgi:pimeloyl-ACP methyl ester carboxylesterase